MKAVLHCSSIARCTSSLPLTARSLKMMNGDILKATRCFQQSTIALSCCACDPGIRIQELGKD
eukprot:6271885-Amphidinium_carterae.1